MDKKSIRHSAIDEIAFLLQYRARTISEIEKKLAEKGYSEEDIELGISKAVEHGWLNDAKYAERLIESAQSGTVKGKKGIVYKLKQKGVADEIIQEAMEGVDDRDELKKAEGVALNIYRNRIMERRKLNDRLWRGLAARGFEYDIISRAIDRVLTDWTDEDD